MTWSFSFKLKKFRSVLSRFSNSSNFRAEWKWHRKRKCSVVSTKVLHACIGLIVSLKPCLNWCSFRWQSLTLKCVRSFAPSVSWTENKAFFFSFKIEFLEMLSDLAFLISTFKLFHSFMQYGKNDFLKVFFLDGIDFIIEADADLRL